jgi:hypothetical protein
MGIQMITGDTHVSEQDMQNALRGAFLEGFKEGVSVSQRSLFANTFLDSLLRHNMVPSKVQLDGCWVSADSMLASGRPVKPNVSGVVTTQ